MTLNFAFSSSPDHWPEAFSGPSPRVIRRMHSFCSARTDFATGVCVMLDVSRILWGRDWIGVSLAINAS